MPDTPAPADIARFSAARRACAYVESGMRVGLGTGSTASWMVRCLGRMVAEDGLRITGVPTSRRTEELARRVGIPVVPLDEAGWLDLTIDGADEIDPDHALVKGGGGALLREKIVAAASDRMVVIADAAKEVATLGAFPLPVEVVPFGIGTTRRHIDRLLRDADVGSRNAELRMGPDAPFITDEGNHILDLRLARIGDAAGLATALNRIPGVVENGLFVDMCGTVVIGAEGGRVTIRDRGDGTAREDRVDTAEMGALPG